jgi:hypothetical protein
VLRFIGSVSGSQKSLLFNVFLHMCRDMVLTIETMGVRRMLSWRDFFNFCDSRLDLIPSCLLDILWAPVGNGASVNVGAAAFRVQRVAMTLSAGCGNSMISSFSVPLSRSHGHAVIKVS